MSAWVEIILMRIWLRQYGRSSSLNVRKGWFQKGLGADMADLPSPSVRNGCSWSFGRRYHETSLCHALKGNVRGPGGTRAVLRGRLYELPQVCEGQNALGRDLASFKRWWAADGLGCWSLSSDGQRVMGFGGARRARMLLEKSAQPLTVFITLGPLYIVAF